MQRQFVIALTMGWKSMLDGWAMFWGMKELFIGLFTGGGFSTCSYILE
jgi:hypothetical protein